MIGWLSGEIVGINDNGLVLNVQGVGYDVTVPTRLASSLSVGTLCTLHIHTSVREDAIVLFGFQSAEDRSVFRLLLSTPGVGPATAIGALSTMSVQDLITAIYNEDVNAIATIPGIGKKTAARLVLELAGKLPSLGASETPTMPVGSMHGDLESALRNLGYGVGEIREALSAIELPDNEGAALRVVLRQLGTR